MIVNNQKKNGVLNQLKYSRKLHKRNKMLYPFMNEDGIRVHGSRKGIVIK